MLSRVPARVLWPVKVKSIRRIETHLEANDWAWDPGARNLGQRKQSRRRGLKRQRRRCYSDAPASGGSSGSRHVLPNIHSTPGPDQVHGDAMDEPRHHLPQIDTTHDLPLIDWKAALMQPHSDAMDIVDEVIAQETRQRLGQTELGQWRAQSPDVFNAAMRMAEIATFWITAGLPDSRFSSFMSWLSRHFPGQVGNINHSWHWVHEFGTSLTQVALRNTAASLHALVPALGLPSDYTRVIDIISLQGVSLLPIVSIHTDPQGALVWSLMGCPALASGNCALVSDSCALASGSGNPSLFRFHGAPRLVSLVHTAERRMSMKKSDRLLRLAMTMADQAIQGHGSVDFEGHEAKVDHRTKDPLRIGVCAFHRADGSGTRNDREFPATEQFDRFLRLVKNSFAWGTGDLVLRAVAAEFHRVACEIRAEADKLLPDIANAEVMGDGRKRNRLVAAREKHLARAAALEKVGWTSFRRPLAPRIDGTRKVVWQSKARRRLFDIFGLVYWGIRARMVEAQDNIRETARAQGHRVTANTGLRNKSMKAWRAMGRTLCDINLLVFNLGRVDFRDRFLIEHALQVQSSTNNHVLTMERAIAVSFGMFNHIGTLIEMCGIVRFTGQLLDSPSWVKRENGAGKLTKTIIWATLKTLLAHRCWRAFPGLVRHLPHILLSGTFQGVSLHSGEFDEPASGGSNPQQATGSHLKWERCIEARKLRFHCVLRALDMLIRWARRERQTFLDKVVGYRPGNRSAKVTGRGREEAAPTPDDDLAQAELALDEVVLDRADLLQEGTHVPQGFEAALAIGSHPLPALLVPPGQTLDVSDQNLSRDAAAMEAAIGLACECESFFKVTLDRDILRSVCQSSAGSNDASPDAVLSDDEDDSGTVTVTQPAAGDKGFSSGGPPKQSWVLMQSEGRKIKAVPHARWLESKQQMIREGLPMRESFLCLVARVFGGESLLGTSPCHGPDVSRAERTDLRALWKQFDGILWGLPDRIILDCLHDAPAEMHVKISEEEFVDQYGRLRAWLRPIHSQPWSYELFVLQGCMVRQASHAARVDSKAFFVSVRGITESKNWGKHIPRIGETVHVSSTGECIVVDVVKSVCDKRLYNYIMSTPYEDISFKKIWHIVRVYHRCTLLAVPTESLAESVGSILADAAARCVGRWRQVDRFVTSAVLRLAGLRGHGGEEGIMADALNVHFQGKEKGPQGWHVYRSSTKRDVCSTAVQREMFKQTARLQFRPPWLGSTFADCIKLGELVLCKSIPGPRSMWGASRTTGEGRKPADTRRQAAKEAQRQQHPDVMPLALWRRLGANISALAADHLPGRHFR